MIWLLFGFMLLAAAIVVTWPMYRKERRVTPALVTSVAIVLGLSALVYSGIGTPVPPPPAASVEDAVAALDRRLQENPDDIEGWRMLGRSYMQLEVYSKAIAAFERVVAMESPPAAHDLAALGEALLIEEGRAGSGRTAQLFESALAVEPTNSKALFYGGIVAIERGDRELAANRWEALLALSPPPEIEDVLRQRVAEWRGEAQARAELQGAPGDQPIAINVSLGPAAASAISADATVFIIARDPHNPSPPIAATRRTVSELPAVVMLSDADAMLPGRPLSGFDRVEIVARVSLAGGPIAQPGDWYGELEVPDRAGGQVEIVIDRQVP